MWRSLCECVLGYYANRRIREDRNGKTSRYTNESIFCGDRGAGIQFCVYCFNVQPGIEIDYRNGESKIISN